MTGRQKLLQFFYPVLMRVGKLVGKNAKKLDNKMTKAPVSFYTLTATRNNGSTFDFSTLKGKKVLIVNTASNCGYTAQYAGLQELATSHADSLVVLGFPANDFAEQEKGTDEEIAAFCQVNFGVSFPLMKKSTVVKGPEQHPVFQWLTDARNNGWNDQAPEWNFSKYLVSEDGVLLHYFGASIAPDSKEITSLLS